MSTKNNALREQLADYSHNAWSEWMKYLFEKCRPETRHRVDIDGFTTWEPTGNLVIPKDYVERWKRQMDTSYEDLPAIEKHSDLVEADKIIKIIINNIKRVV